MARQKNQAFTEKEAQIMHILWKHGPMHVREMLEHYHEPRPHFNTVSTLVRILEQNGHIGHTEEKGGYCYHAVSQKEDFRRRSLGKVIADYFDNSYLKAVSALIKEEKISEAELRHLLEEVEQARKEKGGGA